MKQQQQQQISFEESDCFLACGNESSILCAVGLEHQVTLIQIILAGQETCQAGEGE